MTPVCCFELFGRLRSCLEQDRARRRCLLQGIPSANPIAYPLVWGPVLRLPQTSAARVLSWLRIKTSTSSLPRDSLKFSNAVSSLDNHLSSDHHHLHPQFVHPDFVAYSPRSNIIILVSLIHIVRIAQARKSVIDSFRLRTLTICAQ